MYKGGIFCSIIGQTPRNVIIEFFLELRELDFSIGDVVRETGLNRATTYNTFKELLESGFLMPTRKTSSAQLHALNTKKKEVQLLIKMFNLAVRGEVEKMIEKIDKKQKRHKKIELPC